MTMAIYIAVFGALGCLSRYYISELIQGILGKGFPYGTLTVNIIGAFLIGLIIELGLRYDIPGAELRTAIVIGFLGGLTTFSSFSLESFQLLQQGRLAAASWYVISSVLVCLTCTWAGIHAARYV